WLKLCQVFHGVVMLQAENSPLGRIKVRVVYFAQAREFAGLKEDEFVLTVPASIRHLFSRVLNVHPEMREIIEIIRPLVNGRLATDDTELNDGDRVAIVPPIAGG
ncbi:MAG: MoaD/ThiS family protein, partial [Candidatus Bathyarchaeia archaeon]